MNQKQINFAAKLYSLSQIALLDEGGVNTVDEEKVIRRAIKRAESALEKMGFNHGFATLTDCIDIAKLKNRNA